MQTWAIEHYMQLFISAAFVIMALCAAFKEGSKRNAPQDFKNMHGRVANAYKLLCRPDGTLKTYSKIGLVLFFLAIAVLVWVVPVNQYPGRARWNPFAS